MEETDELLEELEALFPGKVRPPTAYLQESWWPLVWINKAYSGSAWAVVEPESLEDVVKVVKFSYERGVAINIWGGGSSVTGASAPRGGIVVDMRRLNRVREIDVSQRFAVAESGIILQDFETRLNSLGFTLGQFPQSIDIATLGGYISTMGSGHSSSGYGNIEDVVSRVEVVVPPGEVYWSSYRRVPRSSLGPDLKGLFIGAEGAFGIVTAAEVKIYPLPKYTWRESILFSSFDEGVASLERLSQIDVLPQIARLYDEIETAYYTGLEGALLVLQYSTFSKRLLDAVAEDVKDAANGKFMGGEYLTRILAERQNYRHHIAKIMERGLVVDTVELSTTWVNATAIYREMKQQLSLIDGVFLVTAHLSHIYRHGACLYFTILFTPAETTYFSIWDQIFKVAERHGASISHHHGVGLIKKRYLDLEKPVELYKKIKSALDPRNLINPGRLVD